MRRPGRKMKQPPVTATQILSFSRRLLLPAVCIWFAIYLMIMIYTQGVALVQQHRRLTFEPIEVYVDREGVCDRLSRGMIKPEVLNDSVVYACERWLTAQREFFHPRSNRVNQFDPASLAISAENICTNDTYIIVLIHSHHKYTDRRMAIRKTWGAATRSGLWPTGKGKSAKIRFIKTDKPVRVRMAFIFGRHGDDPKADDVLRQESDRYGDIIQGNFSDSYRNMTLKSLTGLQWVIRHCSTARYLLKCDDDMFINIPAILEAIENQNMSRAIMGPYNEGSRVLRKGKWAISTTDYPFYYYPPYESGSGYVISSDLWQPLLNASFYVPHIFIDDVYITGILGRMVGARHINRSGFAYWTNKAPSVCAILNGTVLTGTRVDPAKQLTIWAELENRATGSC